MMAKNKQAPKTYAFGALVHLTGIEPALSFKNMDLNHTRLPVPPQVHDLIFVL